MTLGLIALLLALAGALLSGVGPAYGDSSSEAAAARAAFDAGNRLYVSEEAGQQVDVGAVADAIDDEPIFVAIVAPNTPPQDVLVLLGEGVADEATYVVVSGTDQAAQSSAVCSTSAQPLLDDAAAEQAATRDEGDLTEFLVDYVNRLDGAPRPGDDGCSDETSEQTSFWSAAPWIAGALIIGIGGGLFWLRNRQRHKATQTAGRRRVVAAALDELARDIDEVPQGRGPQTERALQDARERHIAAADILGVADTASDFDAALRAVREGATAARYARERAGLPVGPAPEVEPVKARRVSGSEMVLIGDEQVVVHRRYEPGAPHFFAGNDELPAGWYTAPVGVDEFFGDFEDDA